MVNSADLYCPSSFEETNGFLTATAPLEVRNTSFQIPMFLSGGVGFQSTHVMPRSYLSGAKISRARAFVFPGLRNCVMLNSYAR